MNELEIFESYMKKEHPFIDVNSEAYAAMRNLWKARVPEGYVVVPKEPSSEIIVAIESKVEDQLKASAIEADPFRLDGETIYEAMIEAVEK